MKNSRVAVVTGANKGVGYHIAKQLVASKLFSTVILACRDAGRGTAAAAEVGGVFMPLVVGDADSAISLANAVRESYGRCDCLVNNAAIAFKQADPTPFEKQTKPTLHVNYFGTAQVTQAMLPLLLESSEDPRIVNVASMAGKLRQVSAQKQKQFSSPTLDMSGLDALVNQFIDDVAARGAEGISSLGWGRSNYGLSKLAVIAMTRIYARLHPSLRVNSVCPGYCNTDMSSHRGTRSASDGAKNAVLLATMVNCPTGAFYQNMKPSEW